MSEDNRPKHVKTRKNGGKWTRKHRYTTFVEFCFYSRLLNWMSWYVFTRWSVFDRRKRGRRLNAYKFVPIKVLPDKDIGGRETDSAVRKVFSHWPVDLHNLTSSKVTQVTFFNILLRHKKRQGIHKSSEKENVGPSKNIVTLKSERLWEITCSSDADVLDRIPGTPRSFFPVPKF